MVSFHRNSKSKHGSAYMASRASSGGGGSGFSEGSMGAQVKQKEQNTVATYDPLLEFGLDRDSLLALNPTSLLDDL